MTDDRKSKPYKGEFHVLHKIDLSHRAAELDALYGPSLHYYYKVDWVNHPIFWDFESRHNGQTSLVVSEIDNGDGTWDVETLNSRYKRLS